VDKVFLTGVLVIALTGVLLPVVNRIFRVSGIPGVAIASAGYLISAMFILSSEEGDILKNFFVSDGVSRFVGALILLSSWLTMLVIYAIKEKDRFVNELIAGLLLSTAGALLLISSNNFLSLVISMELMTMPTYLMVLFVMTKPSIEAGIKYFFNGAFAVGTLLFGVSLLYGISGSLDFSAVSTALNGDFLGIIALIFVLAGFGFKMTAFPFHFWGPDVYDGTCPGVASILTGILKSAVFIAFMRVVYEVFSKSFTKELTVLFAIISAILFIFVPDCGRSELCGAAAFIRFHTSSRICPPLHPSGLQSGRCKVSEEPVRSFCCLRQYTLYRHV
jgi:NADH-quinone oxidoreductase subunit N